MEKIKTLLIVVLMLLAGNSAVAGKIDSTMYFNIELAGNPQNAILEKYIYSYDDMGKRMEVIAYGWDSTLNVWETIIKQITYTNNGFVDSTLLIGWNNLTKKWDTDGEKTAYIYDAGKRVTSMVRTSIAKKDTGSQELYSYNGQGKLILFIRKVKWADNKPLTNYLKDSFSYYPNGLLKDSVHQQWGEVSLTWTWTNRTSFEYDSKNRLAAKTYAELRESDMYWMQMYKSEFIYDAENRVILENLFGWRSIDWDKTPYGFYVCAYPRERTVIRTQVLKEGGAYNNKFRTSTTLHESGALEEFVEEQAYSDYWIGYNKKKYQRDEFGNLTKEERYSRSLNATDTVVWDRVDALVYYFTPKNIKITTPNNGEAFHFDSTVFLVWRSIGVDTLKIEYLDSLGKWKIISNNTPSSDSVFLWTAPQEEIRNCVIRISALNDSMVFDVTDKTISIIPNTPPAGINNVAEHSRLPFLYPNPAKDIIQLSIGMSGLTLMDMEGKTIRSFTSGIMSVEGIAPGLYIAKIMQDDKPIFIKLIIE